MDDLWQFHFLRPWWLVLIPLTITLLFFLRKQTRYHTGFEQWIDKSLLNHLSTDLVTGQQQNHTSNDNKKKRKNPFKNLPLLGLALCWIITCLALAGPTWKQLPQPLHESQQAVIIILDLSPSMRAQDNKPSRIVRAHLKIQDLLNQRKDGLTALIAYAGEAHIVTPLTDDVRTISNLLNTLEPGLLPLPGSNTEMAVAMAKQLALDSGLSSASLLLLTDGVDKQAFTTIQRTLDNRFSLYIIGLGTDKGAPIPLNKTSSNQQASQRSKQNSSGFLKDDKQQLIIAKRNSQELTTLAKKSNGVYLPLQADNSDIEFILKNLKQPTDQAKKLDRNVDQWHEFGPTLLLLLLPLAALSFRRGWLLIAFIGITPIFTPNTAYALSWDSLWLNKDQQGEKAFKQDKFSDAEEAFNNPKWRGSAAYKNKDYQAAADAFAEGNTAVDDYNRGNALGQLGEYDEAIEAYNQALKKMPGFDDAQHNKKIIEELKKKQEQQENQQKDNENNQDGDQNSEQNDDQNGDQNDSQKNEQGENQENEEKDSQSKDQGESSKDQQSSSDNQQNGDDENDKKNDAAESKPADTEKQDDLKTQEQQAAEQAELSPLDKEKQQALQQWIRKIPDDPSGLLRRKFEYEFQKRRDDYQQGEWKLPENNAHKRY